jgi:hypothetical protein
VLSGSPAPMTAPAPAREIVFRRYRRKQSQGGINAHPNGIERSLFFRLCAVL